MRPMTASIPSTIIEEPAQGEDLVSSDVSKSSAEKTSASPESMGSPSNLPSMAWDENAPPADHPHKHLQTENDASMSQQSSHTAMSDSEMNRNSENSKPSPSMKVVANFLG